MSIVTSLCFSVRFQQIRQNCFSAAIKAECAEAHKKREKFSFYYEQKILEIFKVTRDFLRNFLLKYVWINLGISWQNLG